MDLSVGTRLGVYEIVASLGAGGDGRGIPPRDTKLGRSVAIKVLPHALGADADRIARFEREARALAALNHPHRRWVAYTHSRNFASSMYVQPFPSNGSTFEIGAGLHPRWSYDGMQLFFPPRQRQVASVSIRHPADVHVRQPRVDQQGAGRRRRRRTTTVRHHARWQADWRDPGRRGRIRSVGHLADRGRTQQAADDGYPCYPVFANDSTFDSIRGDGLFESFLVAQRRRWEEFKKLAR